MASVDNGHGTSALSAYLYHQSNGLTTIGIVAATAGEATRENLPVNAAPVAGWPHHMVLDFNALPRQSSQARSGTCSHLRGTAAGLASQPFRPRNDMNRPHFGAGAQSLKAT